MRVGIILFSHESNTFVERPTTLTEFQGDTLLEGEAIRERFADAHHEVGGFLEVLSNASVDAVPIFAARALPSGAIEGETFQKLLSRLLKRLDEANRLDGLLVAPHGAMVSQTHADADGHWLAEVRHRVGSEVPIIGTLDPHANLSVAMVASCDALVAYRSNPHLDQRDRGREAAFLMLRTLRCEIRPTMHATFPPMAINIERQMTTEPHMRPLFDLADQQLLRPGLLSNSILLGFPYADVNEMGSAVISVANDDRELASRAATELGQWLWNHRKDYLGQMIDVEDAFDQCERLPGPICLLDMGDNVGGGSAADGTWLAHAIQRRHMSDTFICLFDPEAVSDAVRAGSGNVTELIVGGKTDRLHGPPLAVMCQVLSITDGRFSETQARHGGISEFNQGRTAIVKTEDGMTIMLTSKRMVPFSLQQLIGCGLDPCNFRILVAKGVNAPVAAYREVCSHLIRVNTAGSTCADMLKLTFRHRRRPMYPFESDATWVE